MTVLAHPLWTTLSQGVDDRRQRAKMMDELCSSLRKGDVALLLATSVDGSHPRFAGKHGVSAIGLAEQNGLGKTLELLKRK